MKDPYLYPGMGVLKNKAGIKDSTLLSQMEAEYTSSRISDLVVKDAKGLFDFSYLCQMHYNIFQDIFEWAGNVRLINIEKEEPALGGISIEYSDWKCIDADVKKVFDHIGEIPWSKLDIFELTKNYSKFLGDLWKIHPFREGNTRTIVTFCCQFIENQGYYINSDLFQENAQYVRTSLVAYNAIFHDLGDLRKSEYLEQIVKDALERGAKMKDQVIRKIERIGHLVTEDLIREVIFWNREEGRVHNESEISVFCENRLNRFELRKNLSI